MNINAIKEIEESMSLIDTIDRKTPRTRLTAEQERKGLASSETASKLPTEQPMTPIMHNILVACGDIDDDGRLLVSAPETNAEKFIMRYCKQRLLQQCGQVLDHYNTNVDLCDPVNYYVDCYLNLGKGFRQVAPDALDQVNDMIRVYTAPTAAIDIRQSLSKDMVFDKAVEVVLDQLPQCDATNKIIEINAPFMTKHTGVSFPYWFNDRTVIDDGSNRTYAQVTMDDAEVIKNNPRKAYTDYSVDTEYVRLQWLKGRLIQARSRVQNLVFNQQEAIEIQNYKARSPMFAGYRDAHQLRLVMTEMTEFAKEHGYKMYNLDYHRYDAHVSKQWIELLGGISAYKAPSARAKAICQYRAAAMLKSKLVSGTLGRTVDTFGRIESGFIDTNRGGGLINGINMTNLVMRQDPHYVRDIAANSCGYYILVMGDDVLIIVDPAHFDLTKLATEAEKYGFEIDDPLKNAYGPKFLQYRLVESGNGLVFVYPWTRVLHSMLFTEKTKGLTPTGWTFAWYQQLDKLRDWPEQLANVVNFIACFDREHLSLDTPVSELLSRLDKEEEEAKNKMTDRERRHFTSAHEKLQDNDPSKQQQFKDGKLDGSYYQLIQDACKKVYDPSFLPNHGIAIPHR